MTAVDCEVVVVGGGPYGLSAAAHLRASGLDVRVFGEPMAFWATTMPEGMLLRSPRAASSISDPGRTLTLEAFETASGRQAGDPVRLDAFVEYGRWFQEHLGPIVDRRKVMSIGRDPTGFVVRLDGEEQVRCRRVVVAAGIGPFRRTPSVCRHLDPGQASHCYEGRRLDPATFKRVAVIGGGQSALESAALLHEAGADVEVIARQPELRWVGMHSWAHHLGPLSALLYSKHDVGPAGISRLVAMPGLVRHIPLVLRDRIRRRAVRPAGARWLPDRLRHVKITTGRSITQARSLGREVELTLNDGSHRSVDHVLMGTGYAVDIARYEFMSPDLVASLRTFDGYPVLSPGLGSSVPGLHFIGATAARAFGPLLYFVAGTEFASRNLAACLARQRSSQRRQGSGN
jgi:FAD-dependent urate hydroxylase